MTTYSGDANIAPHTTINQEETKTIRTVILIVDMEGFGIGDAVIAFGNLKALKLYLNNPSIDLYTNQFHYAVLENNPCIDRVFFDIDAVAFEKYDMVLLFSDKEFQYKDRIKQRCEECGHGMSPLTYSLCPSTLPHPPFPFYEQFLTYARTTYLQERTVRGQEVFISPQEKAWSEQWFKERNVKPTDKIVVILDNSSGRQKLLNTEVFFGLVSYFKEMEDVKILIYEEKNDSKEKIYYEWFKEDLSQKFLFVKDSTLRKDICLLASDCVKMIFGPCTGLMHCATGIYNAFRNNGTLTRPMPSMITYIGKQTEIFFEVNAWDWWGESLVDCIYVHKDRTGKKNIRKLVGPFYNCLPCSEFTGPLLTDYIEKNYCQESTLLGIRSAPRALI